MESQVAPAEEAVATLFKSRYIAWDFVPRWHKWPLLKFLDVLSANEALG